MVHVLAATGSSAHDSHMARMMHRTTQTYFLNPKQDYPDPNASPKYMQYGMQAAASIGADDTPPSVASAPSASVAVPEKLPEVTEKPATSGNGNGAAKGGDWESLEWRRYAQP